MDEKRRVQRGTEKEILPKLLDALDLLEARLGALTWEGKSKVTDLLVQLRLKIIEVFSHVETGTELESDAS